MILSERQVIQKIVENRLGDLKRQLDLSEISSQIVQLDQNAAGRVSRIDAIQQQKMAASSMIRDKKLVLQLDTVLTILSKDKNAESSNFGICGECGEEISFARLKIKPESEYCIDCQSRLDLMQLD